MMILIFVVMLPLAWSYGPNTQGGGAYAYVDSLGNRYGGTYGLKNGQIVNPSRDLFLGPVPFSDTVSDYPGDTDDDFGASYFANLENLLQEVFRSNLSNQRLAFNAAKKAFDLTSNHAGGYYQHPNIPSRFPAFNALPPLGFPYSGFPMPNPASSSHNSAFASAVAGPGYAHQVASIYPENNANSNVDQINHYSDTASRQGGGFYSVSSKSFSSSSNLNGKEHNNRGAETTVNNNGRVSHYAVRN